jgi:hypothetical protein
MFSTTFYLLETESYIFVTECHNIFIVLMCKISAVLVPVDTILRNLDPQHILIHYFLKIHCNIIHQSSPVADHSGHAV